MEIIDAIKTRKSIRGYKSTPVPKKIIEEILEITKYSPSAMNTQPWEFVVITGETLENIKKENIEMLRAGTPPHPENLVVEKKLEGEYRTRQIELAKQIFQLMGIERENKEKRQDWMERGFRFFDAPCAIIVCVDRILGETNPLLDIGIVIQTICLAALNYNLGTCIEDQGVMYPDVLRKYTGIHPSKKIVISIAIGYPDFEFPANKLRSNRESLKNLTTWYGFE